MTTAILWTQALDLFWLGKDQSMEQNIECSETVRIILTSERMGLTLMCLKLGKEVVHNLNSGHNFVEMVFKHIKYIL